MNSELKNMTIKENTSEKRIGFFEKYLTIWVALGIAAGIGLGYLFGNKIAIISSLELAGVNIPVAVLIWLMIYPMMLQVDFSSIKQIGKKPRGIVWTLIVNWAIKPFSMAFFAWIFFSKIYADWIDPALAGNTLRGPLFWGQRPAQPWFLCGVISPTAIPTTHWCRFR